MANNRRLRSDAAPFRPSAAAAAATHHHPYAAATRYHEWEIGYHQLNFPDCVPKFAVTINGQTAGPTILAVQGDTIVVRVKNSLLTENVAIHWHGIRQMGTEGAPIPPGDFFTCNFVVDRPGTYTYQAHYYSMQGSAVLTGHIVVQEPFRYDGEHSVLLNDLWHKSTCEPLVCVGEPRSLLINGRGRFVHCSNMAAAGTSNATNPECATPVFAGVPAQNNLCSTNIMPEDTVQSVWRDNCAEVFQDVVNKLRQPRRRLYAALDLEFVAEASTDVDFKARSLDQWYHHLHAFVSGGDVVQVGLALAFEHEHRSHGGPLLPVIALDINLEFDEDTRQYNATSIDFLAEQGHRLADHRNRGVPVKEFLDGLMRHLVPGGHDDPITWIMFHGDNDLGFLMRLLQGALPSDRATFMREVRRQFPIFYDLRVLGQLVMEGFRGKFSFLAELLGVERVGQEHHAGSDALLTMSCFSEILRRSQHEMHRLEARKCLLSGMEDLNMPIKAARRLDDVNVKTVPVREADFDEQARWIEELVTSNFKIIGVDVSLPSSGWDNSLCSAAEPKEYDLMSSLEGIGECQVVLGFMNADGMLALGRVWKFYLRIDPAVKNDCVDPGRLARLLESSGATHNPDVVWITYQGLEGIACLIKSSMAAGDLPSDWCSYNEHQRARFPVMYDVGLIAQRCPDVGGCIEDIARNQEVTKEEDKEPGALLVLRCYKRLEESPHFPLIASVVQGQLMASRSCCL
nr:unnamed protein product [Digitaria exilis]